MATETMSRFTEGLLELLKDPAMGKVDVACYIKTQIDQNDEISDVFDDFTDVDLEDVFKNNPESVDPVNQDIQSIVDNNMTVTTDENGNLLIHMMNVAGMDKELRKSFASFPTKDEARFLKDLYYQMQSRRISLANQYRSLTQQKDKDQPELVGKKKKAPKNKTENKGFLEQMLFNISLLEAMIKKGLDLFSNYTYLGKWAKSNIGIGPVFATCLAASLELKDDDTGKSTNMHAGNFWSYCGLNDNNRPRISSEDARNLVREIVDANNGIIDNKVLNQISAKSKWPVSHLTRWCTNKETGVVKYSKEELAKAISLIPYNKDLKVTMHLIGDSFLKQKNKPDSLYGKILKDRIEYENRMNAQLAYKDQAEAYIKRKGKENLGKSQKEYYMKGMLPPGHILNRAMRHTVKVFISHFYEAAYYNKYGRMAPNPYVIMYKGHVDYIPPEVPYTSIPRDKEYELINPTDPSLLS